MATQNVSKVAMDNQPSKTKKIAKIDEVNTSAVAKAAYYIAEQRGFAPGYEVEDWLAAEQVIKNKSTSA